MAGLAIGGPPGMIAGGIAGGTAADVAARKYWKGDEITPASVGQSALESALAEVVPAAGIAAAKPLAKQAWKVMRTALDMPTSISAKHQGKIIQTALDEGLTVNAKSIDQVGARIKSLSEQVTERAAEMTAQGQKIQIDQVIKITKDHIKSNLGTWMGGQHTLPSLSKRVQSRNNFVEKVTEPDLRNAVPSGQMTPDQLLDL